MRIGCYNKTVDLSLLKDSKRALSGLSAHPEQVDLVNSRFIHKDGTLSSFAIEDWPIALFLRGLGAESIWFKTHDLQEIENWIARIAAYEQSYINDPENFRTEDCKWNEVDPKRGLDLVVVRWPTKPIKHEDLKFQPSTPPLDAPIGLDPESIRKFKEEIVHQSAVDVILRTQYILKEFEAGTLSADRSIFGKLLVDVICVALENKLLDKAAEIAELHAKSLALALKDDSKLLQLLGSFDPKATELISWGRIFNSVPTLHLLRTAEVQLSSKAGPQLVKLINLKISHDPDEMIEISFKEKGPSLKALHQWLTPHWQAKHYEPILHAVEHHLDSPEILDLWITALLRSDTTRALADLSKYFSKPSLFSKKKKFVHVQDATLKAIIEHPTTEALGFLREVRSELSGKQAFKAEQILDQHKHMGDL